MFGFDPVDMSFGTPKASAKLATIGIPVAFIGETVDRFSCAPAWHNYRTLYDAATSPAVVITALDADHTMFQHPGCLTAFFARESLGDESVGAAFKCAGTAADVEAGLIQVTSK